MGKEIDVPVYSMTGYASAQRSVNTQADAADSGASASAQLGLEIRCVNSRFLDLSLRLPEDLRQLEPALRDAVGSQLKRGKVELRVSLDSAHAGGVADPSEALLKRLVQVQARTTKWLPQATPLGVADVVRMAANEQSSHRDWSADVLSLAQDVLAALAQARAREGARLADMLHSRVQELRALAAQAERPLLAANEMANLTRAAVVEKLRRAAYAPAFRKIYGENSLNDVEIAFAGLSDALQRYQLEAPEFHPFDSKYDAYLAGKAALSDAEMRGLHIFNDEKRGNCAACHPSAKREDGTPPLFTDFTYDALGVARNKAIPANADPAHLDMGLCKSGRSGRAAQSSECGKFKVPTLRNVATRQVFFHNGQVTSLRDAVAFYISRDTHPEKWYPTVNGKVKKFDDLPAAYHRNVNVEEVPYDRKRGEKPALSDKEVDDVVTFLRTLNDGYRLPQNPAGK
ncbi:MAG: hypothetical protein EBR18_06000 [Betaproteobacteria bacterium]|nr:hypothetical protein [Betaproteobacteria bacterium]